MGGLSGWRKGLGLVVTSIAALLTTPAAPALAALSGTGPVIGVSAKEAQKRKVAPAKRQTKTAKSVKSTKSASATRAKGRVVRRVARVVPPPRPSFGQIYGLHATLDPLALKSSVALVLDQDTHEVLLEKNPQAVLPIASITKLMTAVVVTEAGLPLDEGLTITQEDVDTEKGSRSRLAVGTVLSREEMLHLALMSSENRAAHALGRHYPGGMAAFVAAMNHKAQSLGMHATRYVEPTGLSSDNQSSARDLATLVDAAYRIPLIRDLSTTPEFEFLVGSRPLQFHTTNGLVKNPLWAIGLQKTGYISEAGRCLVMQTNLAGRNLILVLLDSAGRYARIGDAERVRKWLLDGLEDLAEPSAAGLTPAAPSVGSPPPLGAPVTSARNATM